MSGHEQLTHDGLSLRARIMDCRASAKPGNDHAENHRAGAGFGLGAGLRRAWAGRRFWAFGVHFT